MSQSDSKRQLPIADLLSDPLFKGNQASVGVGSQEVSTSSGLPDWLANSSRPAQATIEDSDVAGLAAHIGNTSRAIDLEPRTSDLGKRAIHSLVTGIADIGGIKKAIETVPQQLLVTLMPGDLKQVPTRKLAEEGFGLRRSPEQIFAMLHRGLPTPEPGERERYIRNQRADIVKLVEKQNVVQIARDELIRTNVFGIDGPPDTVMEKITEGAFGLAAFVVRLAALGRVSPSFVHKLPKQLMSPVIWEVENQIHGGRHGAGAEMAIGLQSIELLPIPIIPKTLAQSSLFVGAALAQGADEVDIAMAAALPWIFRGRIPLHALKVRLSSKFRSARTDAEITSVLDTIRGFADSVAAENAGQPLPDATIAIRQYFKLLTAGEKATAKKDIEGFRKENAKRAQEGLAPISDKIKLIEAAPVSVKDITLARLRKARLDSKIETSSISAVLVAPSKATPKGKIKLFRREGFRTEISKHRGRFFAESEQGIEDATLLAKGGADLQDQPLITADVKESEIRNFVDLDNYVRAFATPEELKILKLTDRHLLGDGKILTKRMFKSLNLPESLRFLIGQPDSMVPVLEVIAARGARRAGVKWVRMTSRGGGMGGFTELVEIPQVDPAPSLHPGSNAPVPLPPTKNQIVHGVHDTVNLESILRRGLKGGTQLSSLKGQGGEFPIVLIYDKTKLSTRDQPTRPDERVIVRDQGTLPVAIVVDPEQFVSQRSTDTIANEMEAILGRMEKRGFSPEVAGDLLGSIQGGGVEGVKARKRLESDPEGKKLIALDKETDASEELGGETKDFGAEMIQAVEAIAEKFDIPIVLAQRTEAGVLLPPKITDLGGKVTRPGELPRSTLRQAAEDRGLSVPAEMSVESIAKLLEDHPVSGGTVPTKLPPGFADKVIARTTGGEIIGKITPEGGQAPLALVDAKPPPKSSKVNKLNVGDPLTFNDEAGVVLAVERTEDGRLKSMRLSNLNPVKVPLELSGADAHKFVRAGVIILPARRKGGRVSAAQAEVLAKIGAPVERPALPPAKAEEPERVFAPLATTSTVDPLKVLQKMAARLEETGVKGKRVLDLMRRDLGRLPTAKEVRELGDFSKKNRGIAAKMLADLPAEVKKAQEEAHVLTIVGPDGDPVMRNDLVKPILYNKARPTVHQNFEEFNELFRQGRTKIADFIVQKVGNNSKDLWDFLVKDKRISVKEKPKATKERTKKLVAAKITPEAALSQRKAEREISFESTIEGDFGEGQSTSELVRARAEEVSEGKEQLDIALTQMSEVKREILKGRWELQGTAPKSIGDLAEQFNLPEEDIIALEKEAQLDVRRAMDEVDADEERRAADPHNRRTGPGEFRRGIVAAPNLTRIGELLLLPLKAADMFVTLEAKSMTEILRLRGGAESNRIADFLNLIIDGQQAIRGRFQRPQTEAQIELRTLSAAIADWNLQRRPYATEGREGITTTFVLGIDGQPLPVAGKHWTIDAFADMARGLIKPNGPQETKVVQRAAWDMHLLTGEILEQIKLKIELASGEEVFFKKAEGGRTFLTMPTQEFYDVLSRGRGASDLIWVRMEQGMVESNPGEITLAEAQGIMDTLWDMVTQNDQQAGYRHIGPELAKRLKRIPTGIMAKNGQHIQLLHTEAIQYMNAGYNSTAARAGYVVYLGQDGKKTQDLRKRYTHPDNGGRGATFDAVIRTLSDIPPMLNAQLPMDITPSPSSIIYSGTRLFSSYLDLTKQFLLSSTAPIQVSENLGFIPLFGGEAFIRALQVASGSAETRKIVMDELIDMGIITKNVLSFMVDRSHPASSSLRTFAGVLSRAHGNQFANELINELPAGLMAHSKMALMIERGRRGEGPTENDMHFLRDLLEYPEVAARRLASGQGSSGEYAAMARRGARLAVGSTATSPQKSVLRNSRWWSVMFPFTQFFSINIRTFSKLIDGVKSAHANDRIHKNEQSAERLWVSLYKLGSFSKGKIAAGLVANYIFEAIRQGPLDAFGQLKRDFENDPVEMIWNSFIAGIFGPVYGVLYHSLLSVFDSDVSSEEMTLDLTRAVYPLHVVGDIIDAVKGTGPFKNRSGAERAARYFTKNLPVLKTVPITSLAQVLGINIEDPKTREAVKSFWKWMYDSDNESVPGGGGSPGSRTDEDKEIGIHLRRSFEAQSKGENPRPHLLRAFGVDNTVDLSAAMKSRKLLNHKKLNDEKRRKMENDIGFDKMQLLIERDNELEIVAAQSEAISKLARVIQAQRSKLDNIVLRATTLNIPSP